MGDWENRRIQHAPPQPGKPGGAPYGGSVFVVILIDAHNGLQMDANQYTAPGYKSPTQKTMYQESTRNSWRSSPIVAQVVYCYSDFAARFQLDSRLDEESRALAEMARMYGLIPYSLSNLWVSIKPLCLGLGRGEGLTLGTILITRSSIGYSTSGAS